MNRKNQSILVLLLLMLIMGCKLNSKKEIKVEKKMTDLEVLVGTYTNDKSKGIYKLTLNNETGEIKNKKLLVELENPSFLAVSENGEKVYAIQENVKGKVFSFKWNKVKTKLIEISNVSTNGMHPCYVSLNDDENLLSVGNYSSGNVSFFQLEKNGEINNQFQTKQHDGQGTFLPRQEKPHVHCTKFYKNNFLYVVDLGIDEIIGYSKNSNKLGKGKTVLKSSSGDGFRHLTFHPKKSIAYVTTEFTNSIIVSKINESTGNFTQIQKISLLPKSYSKESFAADIHLSNDGKFLYASNRGNNSIATYSVNNEGVLTLINHTDVEGNWPRNFGLSKDNKFLIVANQYSNNITVFKRDLELGTLTYTGFQTELSVPVFVKFL